MHDGKDVIYQVEVFLQVLTGSTESSSNVHVHMQFTHDGSGHTVLGSRAVFWVCCVLILCPFGLFIWTRYVAVVSSNFAQGVCSTIFVLADRFPCVSNPVCL